MNESIVKKDKSFVVPQWVKISFIALAMSMLFGAIVFHVDKRTRFSQMLIENALMPIPTDINFADLSFKDGEGHGLPVNGYLGKWLLVNFWATWCLPCRAEMPSLFRLQQQFAGKMEIVAVSVDEQWESVIKFFINEQVPFTLAWDPDKKIADSLNIDKYPETFLIDPRGQAVVKFIGPRDWSSPAALEYFSQVFARTEL